MNLDSILCASGISSARKIASKILCEYLPLYRQVPPHMWPHPEKTEITKGKLKQISWHTIQISNFMYYEDGENGIDKLLKQTKRRKKKKQTQFEELTSQWIF